MVSFAPIGGNPDAGDRGRASPSPYFTPRTGPGLESGAGGRIAARLALAARAVLLPVFLEAGTVLPFRLVIGEPIRPPQAAAGAAAESGRDAAALAMTEAWVAAYAARVVAAPGWWHGLEAHVFP